MMNPGKTKVILVGNSRFPSWGGETKDILNVDQNMEGLKKIFLNADYCGIPIDHLIEIKDQASREILLQVKRQTKSSAEKGNFERLIFYYSGHGIPGEDYKLFLASNDTIRSDYEITSVDSKLLFSYLKGFGAKQLIIILDCCYAAQAGGLGDPDSMIENCLEKKVGNSDTGAYYLYAAGKDNVAKFNPKEPGQPTYFTKALLSTIENGTESGEDYITMGELCRLVCSQILNFNNTLVTDIPEPWPVMEGNNVEGFHFCKNKKFRNQEDIDWDELVKDPSLKKIGWFEDKYRETAYESEKDELRNRLIEGINLVKKMNELNDLKMANKIKLDYKDIPMIKDAANQFMRDLAAKTITDENEIEVLSNRKATDTNTGQKITQAAGNLQTTPKSPGQSPGSESKSNAARG